MRVLHIIPSLSPKRGGPTEVALNLVRELNALGITAEICTTNDDGEDVLDVPLGDRTLYRGVPVWFFPRFTTPFEQLSLGRDRSFLFSSTWAKWLWQNIPNYDVLDTHYLFAFGSTAAAMVARRRDVPYTMRTMGQLAPWALTQSRKKKQLYSWLRERKNLNRAAAVHCTTEGEANDVRQFGITAPAIVLPLGVWPGKPITEAGMKLRQRYALPFDVPIMLFLGRLHYKKRPEFLLDMLAGLNDIPFHLLLAGTSNEPDYLQALQAQVERLQLSDRVTFTGLVTGEEKELVLQGSDLFVLPSFAENFAIAVAEAMAAGLPVIVTPEVQLAPLIARAQAGLIVEAQTHDWQQAIAQLLTNPEMRHTLGANGQHLTQTELSWPAIAQQLAELYQLVIDHHPHHCS